MKNDHKSKLVDVWERIKADAKMDNATKAKITRETVQGAVTGLQEAVNPERYFCANPDFPLGGRKKR